MFMNRLQEVTYICHNGTSTIDLVFLKSKLKMRSQDIMAPTTIPPREHLPIKCIFSVPESKRIAKKHATVKLSRTLGMDTLR
jgi:hypothetical protein